MWYSQLCMMRIYDMALHCKLCCCQSLAVHCLSPFPAALSISFTSVAVRFTEKLMPLAEPFTEDHWLHCGFTSFRWSSFLAWQLNRLYLLLHLCNQRLSVLALLLYESLPPTLVGLSHHHMMVTVTDTDGCAHKLWAAFKVIWCSPQGLTQHVWPCTAHSATVA
jgi:hypothetical protein